MKSPVAILAALVAACSSQPVLFIRPTLLVTNGTCVETGACETLELYAQFRDPECGLFPGGPLCGAHDLGQVSTYSACLPLPDSMPIGGGAIGTVADTVTLFAWDTAAAVIGPNSASFVPDDKPGWAVRLFYTVSSTGKPDPMVSDLAPSATPCTTPAGNRITSP